MAEIRCGTSDLVTKYVGRDESLNMTADSLRERSLVQAEAVRASGFEHLIAREGGV